MALTDYEDTLRSYILDDYKLVTYKWLSKEFELHVNVAKDLLKQYWTKNKDEEHIVAVFLLVGQSQDNSIRIQVVKEENLSAARNKFVKIHCEHLYSLQKSLDDIDLLALTEDGDIRFSAIKHNEEYTRNNEEIESLRYVGYEKKEENKSLNKLVENKSLVKQLTKQTDSLPIEKNNSPIDKKADNKQTDKLIKDEKSFSKNLESKTKEKIQSTEKKVSPKGNARDSSKINNNKVSKKPIQSKQSGFQNLFSKVQNKSKSPDNSKEDLNKHKSQNKEDNTNERETMKSSGTESSEKDKTSLHCDGKSTIVKKSEIKEIALKNKKSSRGKKRNRSQENDAASKRKRIVVMDLSSEDELDKQSDDDEEEEDPMEIEKEPVQIANHGSPSPPSEKRENGKRMVSKFIDKTYKDEDGFLVTKVVQTYEAVSDNEDTEAARKEESNKPKPADIKIKKKQTTLMNFFKKS